jgi:hypothetical protein
MPGVLAAIIARLKATITNAQRRAPQVLPSPLDLSPSCVKSPSVASRSTPYCARSAAAPPRGIEPV